jgi:long-chain acyl-CoA synthetase
MTRSTGLLRGVRRLAPAELEERARRAAAGFAACDVGPGEAVALLLRNDLAFMEATLGAQHLGAQAVPINWHFKAEEVAYILADCRPRLLVAHADLIRALDAPLPPELALLVVATPPEIARAYAIAPEACQVPAGAEEWEGWLARQDPQGAPAPRPGDSMIYTSGTTGHPKGVRRLPATPEQAAAAEGLRRLVYGFRPGMRTAIDCPLYHSAPNAYAVRGLAKAELMILQPRFDPQALLALIEAEAITHLLLTPTHFVRLLKLGEAERRRHDLSSLEHIIHVGAPCPPAVKRAMIDWLGPIINEFYGSTEAGPVTFCSSAEWLARPGTVGRPVPSAVVRIHGEDGEILPQGEIGEIFMRTHAYTDFTYHGRSEDRRAIERDGLITTGDVGYLDEEGYLFLCDRKRDMVISGGVNIYPAEIESVLVTMEGVRDGVVFGIPDEEYGEALLALVEPMPGAVVDPAAVQAFLRRHLADYKVPRRIELRESLPREDSGKIFKRRLREPYWRAAGRAV